MLIVLNDSEPALDRFLNLIDSGYVIGAGVHDARIAAVCLENGATEFLTCDRDYGRFPLLPVRNPFVK
jgi:predicted nucleic acid-binding protein